MHNSDDLSFESLDALLGVIIEPEGKKARPVACGDRPPREKTRTWLGDNGANNFAAFSFGGYVARVTRIRCGCCEAQSDFLEGIFVEEVHLPSGTRRLTKLGRHTDWPAAGGHRKEVEAREVEYCGECIGDLGFDKVVPMGPGWNWVKES